MSWYDWYPDGATMSSAANLVRDILFWPGAPFGYIIAFAILAPLAMAVFNWWRGRA